MEDKIMYCPECKNSVNLNEPNVLSEHGICPICGNVLDADLYTFFQPKNLFQKKLYHYNLKKFLNYYIIYIENEKKKKKKEVSSMFELYFYDLKEDVQKKLLEFYGADNPEQMNFDLFPLCTFETIDIEEDD